MERTKKKVNACCVSISSMIAGGPSIRLLPLSYSLHRFSGKTSRKCAAAQPFSRRGRSSSQRSRDCLSLPGLVFRYDLASLAYPLSLSLLLCASCCERHVTRLVRKESRVSFAFPPHATSSYSSIIITRIDAVHRTGK